MIILIIDNNSSLFNNNNSFLFEENFKKTDLWQWCHYCNKTVYHFEFVPLLGLDLGHSWESHFTQVSRSTG